MGVGVPGDGGLASGLAGRSGVGEGVRAQPARLPRIAAASNARRHRGAGGRPMPCREEENVMWVILLEALGAGLLLVVIVWWTMFHGRNRGERRDDEPGA